MGKIGEGWVDVVSSGARMFIHLYKNQDGSFSAIDPETNNSYAVEAFCAAWLCQLTGNHLGE